MSTSTPTRSTPTGSGSAAVLDRPVGVHDRTSRRSMLLLLVAVALLVGAPLALLVAARSTPDVVQDWSGYGPGSSVYDSQVPGAPSVQDWSGYGPGSSVYDSQVPGAPSVRDWSGYGPGSSVYDSQVPDGS